MIVQVCPEARRESNAVNMPSKNLFINP